MSSYQHIQIAGSRNNNAQLIDVPGPSGGSGPVKQKWQPDITKDDFWGPNWSEWKPPVPDPPQSLVATGASLLDAPIEDLENAKAARDAALASNFQQLRLHRPGAAEDDNNSDDALSTAGAHSSATVSSTAHKRVAVRRMLPHEHEPRVIQQRPRDTTETVDRIFKYLADPPRRRRMVPDEDWARMDQPTLVDAFNRQVKLVRFLIRENGRLVGQATQVNKDKLTRGSGGGVEMLVWHEDEHLDVALLTDQSKEDIKRMRLQELLERLDLVKDAREDLLDMNDEMIRQIEEAAHRQ